MPGVEGITIFLGNNKKNANKLAFSCFVLSYKFLPYNINLRWPDALINRGGHTTKKNPFSGSTNLPRTIIVVKQYLIQNHVLTQNNH